MARLKLSVLCLSYNQKKFIKQCLDSILMQKTNFAFELLINDDASTDGTKKIIEEYQTKYPDIIKPVFHKDNQYSKGKRNMIPRYLLPKVQGKYIALCEGDDFWTDENKLQKQVDFMEDHSDYALCFHPVKAFFENGEEPDSIFPKETAGFTIKKLLHGNFIQTNSVMYRARADYKDIATDVMPGDWYLHLYHAQFGKIGFIDQVMSAYRRHDQGVWWDSHSNKKDIWKKHSRSLLALHVKLLEYYGQNKEYKEIINNDIQDVIENLRLIDVQEGSNLVTDIIEQLPSVTKAAISHYARIIKDKNQAVKDLEEVRNKNEKSIKELQQQIASLKSSKAWKLRNKLAKLIGKPTV